MRTVPRGRGSYCQIQLLDRDHDESNRKANVAEGSKDRKGQ